MRKIHLFSVVASLAVAVGIALATLAYNGEIDRARTAAASGGRIVSTAAGPIEYAEKGSGIPLLSIHGAGGGFDQGIANAAELVGDEFRVIAPSRFGYLGTPIPANSSPAAQADAHAALLTRFSRVAIQRTQIKICETACPVPATRAEPFRRPELASGRHGH